MGTSPMKRTVAVTGLVLAGVAALAALGGWPGLLAAVGVGLGYGLLRIGRAPGQRRARKRREATPPVPAPWASGSAARAEQPEDLVNQMLRQGRYALLLRPQIAANLTDQQFRQAVEALETEMALVPDGEVVLGPIDDALDDGELDETEILAARARLIRVEHFFLDRYPVTNRQFYRFVEAGGYEDLALWDPSILPALLHFVDRTGHPGPAFWENGRYPPGRQDHPVVGISWFEAAAYARWSGKRLPTDPEWVKAGSWPVNLSATTRVQRRYPWGDAMDYGRANLWGAGRADTVPVTEMAEGVSVGGVYQLIGNVWEWTRDDFQPHELLDGCLLTDVPLKSLRGGAFDTYFDNQATCQFQSGEAAMARKHNIGFRTAIGVCDLTLSRPCEESPEAEDLLAEEIPA